MSERITIISGNPDTPVPGSERAWCHICAGEVWISPSAIEQVPDPDDREIVCIDCTDGYLDLHPDSELLPPTQRQLDELREAGLL